MKTVLVIVFAAAANLFLNQGGAAAEESNVFDETDQLITKVQAKLDAGKRTQTDLADELKEFDALLDKHKNEKTDQVAGILQKQAMLYLQVLNNPDKATDLIRRLKREFPTTQPGRDADQILIMISKLADAKTIHATLVKGTELPDFDERDVNRKPLSLASYRGKITLLDFWATWSKPSVAEAPHLLRTYEKYRSDGFEVIGISLDHDELRLSAFTAQHRIPWAQFFDARGWNNALAVKYGVSSIPSNFLLARDGKIIARDLHGQQLENAIANALGSSTSPVR